MTNLEEMVREALDAAGYTDEPTSTNALISCFLDYVAEGYWRDLDYDDAQEEIAEGYITVPMMCKALKKGRGENIYRALVD